MSTNAQAAAQAAATLAAADINQGSQITIEQMLQTADRIADWLEGRDKPKQGVEQAWKYDDGFKVNVHGVLEDVGQGGYWTVRLTRPSIFGGPGNRVTLDSRKLEPGEWEGL